MGLVAELWFIGVSIAVSRTTVSCFEGGEGGIETDGKGIGVHSRKGRSGTSCGKDEC